MLDQDGIAQQLALLAAHHRTLAHLLAQAAQYGGEVFVPPQTANEIAEARANIARIKRALRESDVQVDDEPNGEVPPQEVVWPLLSPRCRTLGCAPRCATMIPVGCPGRGVAHRAARCGVTTHIASADAGTTIDDTADTPDICDSRVSRISARQFRSPCALIAPVALPGGAVISASSDVRRRTTASVEYSHAWVCWAMPMIALRTPRTAQQ